MQEGYTNIYREARQNAQLTIEKASEYLDISTSSLKNYEKIVVDEEQDKKFKVPEKVVMKMAEVYGEPYLKVQHLWNTSKIFREICPNTPKKDLPLNVLYLQSKTMNVRYSLEEMIEIACDGQITDDEKLRWVKVVNEIRGWMEAAVPLAFIG